MTATVRPSTTAGPTPEPAAERPSARRRRGLRNPTLIIGATLTLLLVLVAVCAPLIAPFDPIKQSLDNTLEGPSAHHLLGTDQLGRDVFSRLIYGARADLRVGLIAVLFPFVIGTVLGGLAGYFGRWVDVVVGRLIDIVVAFPFYVLIIALVFVLGSGERSIYIAITAVGWVSYARIVRSQILVARQQDWVAAARSGGLSAPRIMVRHLLPNVISQAIVYAMSDIVQDILAIVTLSYLGLGIQPPTPDWGSMIAQGQDFLTTHWQLSTLPGLAVVLVGISLSLLGDGLADALRADNR